MLKKKSLHFSLLLISIGTGINIQAQPIPAEYLEQMVQQGKNPTREIMRNRSMDVYQKSMTVTAYNNLKGISLPLDTSKEQIAYYLPDLQKIQITALQALEKQLVSLRASCNDDREVEACGVLAGISEGNMHQQ